MKTKNKAVEIYILIIAMAFEAVGAIFGGISLMNDPSGKSIQLPVNLLEGTIFNSYMIPGIILFLLLGFSPLFLIFPLIFKPDWPVINSLNIYKGYHWAWTYTLYTSVILMCWIYIQMMILSTGSVIQGAFGLLGVFILVLTLMPNVKRHYRIQNHVRQHSGMPKQK